MDATSCNEARQILLDQALDEAERRRMFTALQHWDGCKGCQEALRDFDRIRGVLAGYGNDADPPAGWDAFERRMKRGGVLRMPRLPHWWFSLAASVLIGAVMFVAGRETRRPLPGKPSPAPPGVAGASQTLQVARFSPADLPPKVALFEKVIKQFEGQASWIMLSKDAVDMGTSTERLDQSRRLLLLRLTTTRQSGDISDADVLIVPGQTADTNVPLAQGQSLHYRIVTSKDDPTRLSLWLEVQTPGRQQTLATLSTNLQVKPGESLSAGHLVTSAGEYGLRIGVAEASAGGERS